MLYLTEPTMTNIAATRIRTEIKELMRTAEVCDKTMNLIISNDDMTELKAEIAGPPDTPYEGGRFQLEIKIPVTYPFKPPQVTFITKLWHPNILSMTGLICLDILSDQWAATMTLRTVLLSIQALLSAPEPSDPQDTGVAGQYISDPEMFRQTAQHWTNVYAGGPHINTEFNEKISTLVEIGVDEQRAREALSYSNWSLELATETIFGNEDTPRPTRCSRVRTIQRSPESLTQSHRPWRRLPATSMQPRTMESTIVAERITRRRRQGRCADESQRTTNNNS